MAVERIPTGSLGLDIALCGDLQFGRITQIGFVVETPSCLIIPSATDPSRSTCRSSQRAPRQPAQCRH
ncbi:hypothetical protein [Serratia nevei]|uniref:hypothetical protein n=1 Tax=Serratia nevei TaxID=2703794 RepID=UPI00386B8C00